MADAQVSHARVLNMIWYISIAHDNLHVDVQPVTVPEFMSMGFAVLTAVSALSTSSIDAPSSLNCFRGGGAQPCPRRQGAISSAYRHRLVSVWTTCGLSSALYKAVRIAEAYGQKLKTPENRFVSQCFT
jgi:hypothetical protein